jgi:hypothetical protein
MKVIAGKWKKGGTVGIRKSAWGSVQALIMPGGFMKNEDIATTDLLSVKHVTGQNIRAIEDSWNLRPGELTGVVNHALKNRNSAVAALFLKDGRKALVQCGIEELSELTSLAA